MGARIRENHMLRRTLLPSLLFALAAPAMAAMTMTVNAEDGQTLSGTFKFVVRVNSEHLVSNVEFYVGDDLRNTDESTPYEFTLDTLEEKEGSIKVTFAAYNSEGESLKKTFNFKIDNQLSKGIDYHVEQSTELLRESKFDAAIQECRVALKIDPKSNVARLAMARANFAKGVYDLAQKFAQDVLSDDQNNADARALLTAIDLKKAFTASGDDSVSLIQTSLTNAAKNQTQILQYRADNAGAPSGDNLYKYLNAQINGYRYSRVIQVLAPMFESNPTDTTIANYLAFAQIRSAKFTDALRVIRINKQKGEPDGYTFMLSAVLNQYLGQQTLSEDDEKEALLNSPTSDFVKYGQAYLAIARNKVQVFDGVVQSLVKSYGVDSMTQYYLSIDQYYLRNFDSAKSAFETSVLANPASYDVFIERGNQIIDGVYALKLTGVDAKNRQEIAKAYFSAALAARPESFEALTGLSIINSLLGNADEAVSYGRGAVAAAPEYGPAHFALAAAYRLARNVPASGQALEDAGKVDRRLIGRPTPRPEEAWQVFYQNGRMPLIPGPSKDKE